MYRAKSFDPRHGTWSDTGLGEIKSNNIGEIQLPEFASDEDWALSLTYGGSAARPKHF
jgi:hypothetical protein